MNHIPAREGNGQDELRAAFVEMMFALAVGQIAVNATKLFTIPIQLELKVPGVAHLFVALTLIAASWVGWRQSQSPGMNRRIMTVFSWSFVGLLLDVLLVIAYFNIVQNFDADVDANPPRLRVTSAEPEAFGLMLVFLGYAGWDLITDVFDGGSIPDATRWKKLRVAIVSIFASLVCFLLALLVWFVARDATPRIGVIALDIGLAALILLFRSLKVFENWLSKKFNVSDCAAFRKRPSHTPTTHGRRACVAIYLLALTVAFLSQRLPWFAVG